MTLYGRYLTLRAVLYLCLWDLLVSFVPLFLTVSILEARVIQQNAVKSKLATQIDIIPKRVSNSVKEK